MDRQPPKVNVSNMDTMSNAIMGPILMMAEDSCTLLYKPDRGVDLDDNGIRQTLYLNTKMKSMQIVEDVSRW